MKFSLALLMNRGIAPKDSKHPRIACVSSMNALNLWAAGDGSWPQCVSDRWKWRLPTNLRPKSGSKLHALQTLARVRWPLRIGSREAFGVRPACWRFEPLNRRKTFNNQHPTSNIQRFSFDPFLDVGRSMLDVECSRGFVGREIV